MIKITVNKYNLPEVRDYTEQGLGIEYCFDNEVIKHNIFDARPDLLTDMLEDDEDKLKNVMKYFNLIEKDKVVSTEFIIDLLKENKDIFYAVKDYFNLTNEE